LSGIGSGYTPEAIPVHQTSFVGIYDINLTIFQQNIVKKKQISECL